MDKKLEELSLKIVNTYGPGINKRDIKNMFVDGKFNFGNWNGGDVQTFRNFVLNDEIRDLLSWTDGDIDKVIVLKNHIWYDDYNYYTVTVIKHKEGKITTDVYVMRNYKNRGNVEEFLKNGNTITEKEFVSLLNDISKVGYDMWKVGKYK